MNDGPCEANSLGWAVGAMCVGEDGCGHPGLLHPGAGGDIPCCMICAIEDLLYALQQKELILEALIDEARRELMP